MKKKNKTKIIIIGILIVIVIVMGFIVYNMFLNPKTLEDKYGNRLDGIEKVLITETRLTELKNKYLEKEGITSFEILINGKILNFIINADEKGIESKIKPLFENLLEEFNEEELEYYDFGFYVTNNDLEYKLLGTKNAVSENVIIEKTDTGENNEEN